MRVSGGVEVTSLLRIAPRRSIATSRAVLLFIPIVLVVSFLFLGYFLGSTLERYRMAKQVGELRGEIAGVRSELEYQRGRTAVAEETCRFPEMSCVCVGAQQPVDPETGQ